MCLAAALRCLLALTFTALAVLRRAFDIFSGHAALFAARLDVTQLDILFARQAASTGRSRHRLVFTPPAACLLVGIVFGCSFGAVVHIVRIRGVTFLFLFGCRFTVVVGRFLFVARGVFTALLVAVGVLA